MKALYIFILSLPLFACTTAPLRGTGDLAVVIERAAGRVQIINTTQRDTLKTVEGFGDLSHASLVYSRDGQFAFVFGRDGGLTKVNLLSGKIEKRIIQAGNAIGGAISQDGSLIAVSNYEPGGVKVFRSVDLTLVADIPAKAANGFSSKVVGLVDAPGQKFVFSLFEGNEIWVADLTEPTLPKIQKFDCGKQPYDALITSDGRYYIAGLFGEDGLTLLDLWNLEKGTKKVLSDYGKGQQKLPVYKMPHFEGWSSNGSFFFVPAVGAKELLVLERETWKVKKRIPLAGQPVFAVSSPDSRFVWVNFAFPDNQFVQIIDTSSFNVVKTMEPGKGVLHIEFTPRGENAWVSVRDEDRVEIWDTQKFIKIKELKADKPSGIFMSSRAHRIGF